MFNVPSAPVVPVAIANVLVTRRSEARVHVERAVGVGKWHRAATRAPSPYRRSSSWPRVANAHTADLDVVRGRRARGSDPSQQAWSTHHWAVSALMSALGQCAVEIVPTVVVAPATGPPVSAIANWLKAFTPGGRDSLY